MASASRAWGAGGAASGESVFAWHPLEDRTQVDGLGRLRFGTYLAPSMLAVYVAVTEHVGRALGIPTELVVESSYASCERDENEVCFICSLPYVTFERRGLDLAVPIAAPVLQGERYRDRPIYFSDVVVPFDSPVRSFLALRGRTWAYNEPLSHSGYGVVRHHLLTLGETGGFFGRVVEAGFHDEALRMVAAGEVDGAAIDSQVLELAFLADPGLAARIRVVEALGPSTIQPVAVSRRVPASIREEIRTALVTMSDDPIMRARLDAGLVSRFARVEPESYDDIRAMLDACERAGFLELR